MIHFKNHEINISQHVIFQRKLFSYHSSFENNKDPNSLSILFTLCHIYCRNGMTI